MSLGGGNMPTLCSAVTASWNAGVVHVAAAGNSNANACNYSPANCANIVTVGSTTMNTALTSDIRSSFSNWGNCLTTFAPGSDIRSSWIGGNSAYNTISGTSMASPHIAGYVSLLQQRTPSSTPNQIYSAITASAQPNLINLQCTATGCSQSPNLFLYSGC